MFGIGITSGGASSSGHHIRRRILEKGIPKKRVVAETRIGETINEMAIKALGER